MTFSYPSLIFAFLVGCGLGGLNYYLLWKTMLKLKESPKHARLLGGSFLLRMGIILAGLFAISRLGQAELLAAAGGVLILNIFAVRKAKRQLVPK